MLSEGMVSRIADSKASICGATNNPYTARSHYYKTALPISCTVHSWSIYNAGVVVPFALCSAGEIGWHIWEKRVVAVCGVVPVAAIVPVFPHIVHTPAL